MKTNPQHTPWKVQDNRIIQRFYGESWNKQIPASIEDVEIGKFNSCEQAELAALAVNAHEELLKAMRKAIEDIESAMNVHTFPPSCGIPMENAKVVLELAIAKAEAPNA